MAQSTATGLLSEVSLIREVQNGIEFVLEDLKKILCQKNCRNKNVVVISTTGSRRIGKSFLLNYMVRYLQGPGNKQWMGERNEPLRGFDWGAGATRVTRGMRTFDKLFPFESSTGEKVFVMLLDTENLVMLVRNFKHYRDFPFGWKGGEKYWKHVGSQSVKDHGGKYKAINSTSETIKCFLLPYPGENMDEGIDFNGCRGTLTPRFHDSMEQLVRDTINESINNPKTLNGKPLTCGDLYLLCEKYSNLFSSGELPKIRGIDEANVMVHLQIVYQECINLYGEEMKRELASDNNKTLESLDNTHTRISVGVIDKLQTISISSNETLKEEKVIELLEWLSESYEGVRNRREKEIEIEANLSDEELYNGLHDAYVEQMDEILSQCSDVEQLCLYHEQFGNQAVDTLAREMLSQTPQFLEKMITKLMQSIGVKHEADKVWIRELQDNSNADCYEECLEKYRDIMHTKRNTEGHFNSTSELKSIHTDVTKTVKDIFERRYRGLPKLKAVTWNDIEHQLNETYKQFEVSQMNHENLMLSAMNHDASRRAGSLFIQSMTEHFLEEDEFNIHECLAESRALAMTSWNRECKGSPNDHHPILRELSNELELLENKYKACYDTRVHKQIKIREKSAAFSIIGLLGGPAGLAISTPLAMRYRRKEMKKLRDNTSFPED